MEDIHFPQPISNANPNPNPNPSPNSHPCITSHLPTTISLLKDVIFLAESTIKSVSTLLFNNNSCSNTGDLLLPVVCPYDPNHRLPPESLFRHSLVCSAASSPPTTCLDDLGPYLDDTTLHYPNSLKTQPHHHPDAHLPSIGSTSFFYRDCPGVVSFPEPEPHPYFINKPFLLPSILSAQCANFIHQNPTIISDTAPPSDITILPSDFWALKQKVNSWTDFPTTYSYSVLRVASTLDLHKVQECGLQRWLISNSPRFGILIDVAMMDHIFLLLKLCLKVLQFEALTSFNSLLVTDSNSISNHKCASFDSPNLVGSLSWLTSQLSILYGEANAKLFTVDMLKESLLRVGWSSQLFKFGQGHNCGGKYQSVKGRKHLLAKFSGDLENKNNSENSHGGQVFVSQVAAAVSALHERFLLEERIKSLQFSKLLPKHQLVKEYLYASTRASKVREKRPNYRAVLEHDSLFWHRGNGQDMGIVKTKEELLAEERDYKRRRMSYRGKKVKRNPTEVLREIIEEQMEEINLLHDKCDASETKLDLLGYDKPLQPQCNFKSEKCGDIYVSDKSRIVKDQCSEEQTLEHSEYEENHNRSGHKSEKKFGSGNPSICRSHTNLHERSSHLNEQYNMERNTSECQKICAYSFVSADDSGDERFYLSKRRRNKSNRNESFGSMSSTQGKNHLELE